MRENRILSSFISKKFKNEMLRQKRFRLADENLDNISW